MKNPYPTQKGFGLRVYRAEQAIKKLGRDPFTDIYTRSFDNCFEMWDGDAVVWALMDRATKEPDEFGQNLLTEGIQRMFKGALDGQKYPKDWLNVYRQTDQLELF